MSKRTYILRYSLLVKRLRRKDFPDWPELQAYLERELEILRFQDESLNTGYSKRTFDRDKSDLREAFGIDIAYSPSQRGYSILEDDYEHQSFNRMLETFDLFNAMQLSNDASQFIHFEKRSPLGTEHIHGLLHAIKNRRQVSFTHTKFWEDFSTNRRVAPHGLKEFKNRWYLLARDGKDDLLKTFALDRISNLEITSDSIKLSDRVNLEEYFMNCFGVISSDHEPEEIVLAFSDFQGKYVESLPLHHTQEIVRKTGKELRVRLRLHVTFDLEMELLSYGSDVKVIAPLSLRKRIQERHRQAIT